MMKCTLLRFSFQPNTPDVMVAEIVRLEDHPRLGKPSGGVTKTSQVKRVDFEAKIIITLNSTYYYGEG